MKRFKLLSVLFIGLIGLVSFGYCDYFVGAYCDGVNPAYGSYTSCMDWLSFQSSKPTITVYCGKTSRFYDQYMKANGTTSNGRTQNCTAGSTVSITYDNRDIIGYRIISYNTVGFYAVVGINGTTVNSNCPTCDEQYTSEECQQEYSLMPISSCNSEYCGLNGLCPEYTGSTMSELYINGINHLGAPIINLSIPLEQAWDYNYTGDVMNINLSGGNNVDYEYMDNIIRTQNSKPNTTDLNNIVSVLLPKFVPGLVILLLILFIFRFIKKIF